MATSIKKSFKLIHTVILLLLTLYLHSEGTKQIRPTVASFGTLVLNPSINNFALYNCNVSERLNIRINNVNEIINIGIGNITNGAGTNFTDLVFRVLDPNGTVVYGGTGISTPTAGTGYIASYSQAVAGPNTVAAGGYIPIIINATLIGDYWIEFYSPNLIGLARRELELFDVTVTNGANQVQNGRLWSKSWQFSVGDSQVGYGDPYENPFNGKIYIYSDDGVVSKIDMNAMKPLVFAVSCNQYGVTNTGNFPNDCKSKTGQSVIPQYKVFLNDPDSICFPTGAAGAFIGQPQFTGCNQNNFNFNVNVSSSGFVETFINMNGVPGFQVGTSDVKIITSASAGTNTIVWDGTDGLGNPHSFTGPIEIVFNFISGLTNIPLFDVEYNEFGLKVEIIRPALPNSQPALYWNDNLVGGTIEMNGCTNPGGCHLWDGTFTTGVGVTSVGNGNTINTWWYVSTNVLDTVVISPPSIAVSATSTQICINDSIQLTASGGFTYLWSASPADPSLTQTSGAVNNPLMVSPTTSTTYYVTGTDNLGCCNTAQVQVGILPAPVLIPNNPNVCFGDSAHLVVTGANTYEWDVNPITLGEITVFTSSNATYSVTGTDANGCSADTIVQVTVNSLPDVNISPISACVGTETDLTAYGADSYIWSTGQNANPISISISQNTLYYVTGTDSNGCSGVDSILVTAYSRPEVYAGYDTTVCAGQPVPIHAWGNAQTYVWNNNIFGTDVMVVPLQTSTYIVTGSDINDCTNSASVTVTTVPLPTAAYHAIQEIIPSWDHTFQLLDQSLGNPVSWVWNFSTGDQFTTQNVEYVFPEEANGNYTFTLEVKNDFGCSDITEGSIYVNSLFSLYIPNSFTPNGDENNNYFHIFSQNINMDYFSVRIYNRWGQIIFQSSRPDFEWDGTFNGVLCPQGVYVYTIMYRDSDNLDRMKYGSITLFY